MRHLLLIALMGQGVNIPPTAALGPEDWLLSFVWKNGTSAAGVDVDGHCWAPNEGGRLVNPAPDSFCCATYAEFVRLYPPNANATGITLEWLTAHCPLLNSWGQSAFPGGFVSPVSLL